EHRRAAEADDEVAHPDHRVGALLRHGHIPIAAKNMASTPSNRITRKIDFTTASVVLRPSDSALPCTASPCTLATAPMISPMNGALIRPTAKSCRSIASRMRDMYTSGLMPPYSQHISPPP